MPTIYDLLTPVSLSTAWITAALVLFAANHDGTLAHIVMDIFAALLLVSMTAGTTAWLIRNAHDPNAYYRRGVLDTYLALRRDPDGR